MGSSLLLGPLLLTELSVVGNSSTTTTSTRSDMKATTATGLRFLLSRVGYLGFSELTGFAGCRWWVGVHG